MADNPREPYGNVSYADPGYQSDKQKRYPIDTEEHVRAAWSYINQGDNASKYSSEQLASIKGRIKAAAKKFGIQISEDRSSAFPVEMRADMPLDTEEQVLRAWRHVTSMANPDPAMEDRIKAAAKKLGVTLPEEPSDEDTTDQHRTDAVGAQLVETRSADIKVDGVDFGQRIITVLAVPYESPTQVEYNHGIWNEVFSRSAFNGIETRQRRIPATVTFKVPAPNHDGGHLVGRVIGADPNGEQGLVADVKVSRTSYGDEVLALAEDDALSASVGFMVKNPRFDQQLDRGTRTRRINRAFLDHLAFVGQPAYGGTKVLAMRGGIVNEGDVDQPPTPRFDEYFDDPIFRWAAERLGRTV